VDILLRAFEKVEKAVEYFALDLSLPELRRTLSSIPGGSYRFVKITALYGTYDDGLAWLKRTNVTAKATCMLSLGSSIGNFSRPQAVSFLNQFARELKPQDMIIVGIDSCQDAPKVYQAYNDSKGVTQDFYRNGLTHANRLLGYEGFRQSEWEVLGSYNKAEYCHEACYSPKCDVDIKGIRVPKGTKVKFEVANKYPERELTRLWQASGLIHQAAYGNEDGYYSKSPYSTISIPAQRPQSTVFAWPDATLGWNAEHQEGISQVDRGQFSLGIVTQGNVIVTLLIASQLIGLVTAA
jgi:L-histidine Nalpha-methyltransferase / hercynylcysteine S-oxide synthase